MKSIALSYSFMEEDLIQGMKINLEDTQNILTLEISFL